MFDVNEEDVYIVISIFMRQNNRLTHYEKSDYKSQTVQVFYCWSSLDWTLTTF